MIFKYHLISFYKYILRIIYFHFFMIRLLQIKIKINYYSLIYHFIIMFIIIYIIMVKVRNYLMYY